MTLAEFTTLLNTLKIPSAYNVFKEPQKPPYICYIVTDYEILHADNINYEKLPNIQLELYSKLKDVASETKIENLLDENEISYSKEEGKLSDEHLYMVTYNFTL